VASGGDSLVLGGKIELLGGGVPSTQPGAEGAIYRLGKDFDLSSPQMTSDHVAGLLFAGEQVTALRASNRLPKIPVVIIVPSTGDQLADRLTLSAARELLLETTAQDRWSMVWTRDGGLPLTFDCQGLAAIVVNHSLIYQRNLCSLVEIDFEALPFGRSDDAELIVYPAPSQIWDQPPSPTTIDSMTTASSFLQGDASTFEAGIANWVANGNCTVAQTTAQAHGGTHSLQLTATSAATMQAAHCAAANVADGQTAGQGMKVRAGDTCVASAFSRTAVTARSVNIGFDFYDATGTFISTLRGSNVTNSSANFTTNPTCSVTAPAGAAYAIATPQVVSPANGEVHYFDDITCNRGAVYSADDGQTWSLSSITAVSAQNSALWSRVIGDAPIYDHTLATPVDITGRAKLTFWLGLATTVSGYNSWHKGTISVDVILYDPQGDTVEFGAKAVKVTASALLTKPHWQLVTLHIPQAMTGFDYTQVARYSIQVWSHWNQTVPQPDLQASAYICSVVAAPTATGSPVTRGAWYTLPGIIGTARAPIGVQLQPGLSSFSTTALFTTAGSNNWTCPGGVTSIDKVETWGPGGGGAGRSSNVGNPGGGGGGGGAYALKKKVPVTPTTVYHPFVGASAAGGTAGNQGANGQDSYFVGDGGNTTRAAGGRGGWQSSAWGGGKGAPATADADLSFAGGNGHQSNANGDGFGGGGGSSGGTGADGHAGSASDRTGGSPVTGGGPGGYGGKSGSGTPKDGQSPTSAPGGGGGGGSQQSGAVGASSAAGQVRLTYGATGILALASALVHMPGKDAHPHLSPLCPVGTGSDVPNGSTEYTVPAVGALPARFDGSYSVYLINNTWNSSGSSRTVTLTFKQYDHVGGTALSATLARTFTPSTDIVNGYVEMGVITLPIAEISPGNSDATFVVTVTDTNTSDRFYDVLFLDTAGQTVLLNSNVTAFAQNIWLDVADLDRDIGGIYASDTDRDRARSMLAYCDPNSTRITGGPMIVTPNAHNRMLVYSQQGNPGLSVNYYPHWWQDRLQ